MHRERERERGMRKDRSKSMEHGESLYEKSSDVQREREGVGDEKESQQINGAHTTDCR